jgi:hypothetical protein
MNRTVCSLSLGSLLWSSLLFTAAPLLTTTKAQGQFRGRPTPGRVVPGRAAPRRSVPARPAPQKARRLPTPQTPGRRLPGNGRGRLGAATQIPRPRRHPSQAIVPTNPGPSRGTSGSGGSNSPRPPSPVTLTLDSITADPKEKAKARKEAREFFSLHVPAKITAPAVRKVTRLRWHKSIAKATLRARAENKPILWIQALGELKGLT